MELGDQGEEGEEGREGAEDVQVGGGEDAQDEDRMEVEDMGEVNFPSVEEPDEIDDGSLAEDEFEGVQLSDISPLGDDDGE